VTCEGCFPLFVSFSGPALLSNCFGLRLGCVVVLVGVGLLFENCTVDASIFVVSNEERTVDALAPGADEGRRRLR
jgi:hypothetical protein